MKHGKEIEKKMRAVGGFCNESYAAMCNVSTIEELCQQYFVYINDCIIKEFPELDFYRKYIGQSECYGIYTDYTGKLIFNKRISLLGQCSATLEVGDYEIARIWLRHGSKLTVAAKDNAMLYVDCFDDAELDVTAEGDAEVSVKLYGSSKAKGSGENLTVTQTTKKTYADES